MIEEPKRDEMFNCLLRMSDGQVDPIVKERLKTFLGKPNSEIKDEFLGLIDDAVFGSLTSGFEIQVMNMIWEDIGGSKEQLDQRNLELKNPAKREEFKNKYKWQCAYSH